MTDPTTEQPTEDEVRPELDDVENEAGADGAPLEEDYGSAPDDEPEPDEDDVDELDDGEALPEEDHDTGDQANDHDDSVGGAE